MGFGGGGLKLTFSACRKSDCEAWMTLHYWNRRRRWGGCF